MASPAPAACQLSPGPTQTSLLLPAQATHSAPQPCMQHSHCLCIPITVLPQPPACGILQSRQVYLRRFCAFTPWLWGQWDVCCCREHGEHQRGCAGAVQGPCSGCPHRRSPGRRGPRGAAGPDAQEQLPGGLAVRLPQVHHRTTTLLPCTAHTLPGVLHAQPPEHAKPGNEHLALAATKQACSCLTQGGVAHSDLAEHRPEHPQQRAHGVPFRRAQQHPEATGAAVADPPAQAAALHARSARRATRRQIRLGQRGACPPGVRFWRRRRGRRRRRDLPCRHRPAGCACSGPGAPGDIAAPPVGGVLRPIWPADRILTAGMLQPICACSRPHQICNLLHGVPAGLFTRAISNFDGATVLFHNGWCVMQQRHARGGSGGSRQEVLPTSSSYDGTAASASAAGAAGEASEKTGLLGDHVSSHRTD